jgi:tyrosine-protein phosphatase SIW14
MPAMSRSGGLLVATVLGGVLAHGGPASAVVSAAVVDRTETWMTTVRDKADHGDWLVVHGRDVGDQALAAETGGALADAVVLDKDRDEVIEAVAEGVRAVPLRALLARAERLQVVRPPGWTAASGKAAVERARTRVGRKYDWLGPDAADDPRFYAAELCVDAYQGRAKGWKVGAIIFPADIAQLGTLVFDSGADDAGSLLEARFARRLPEAHGVSYAALVAPGLYRGGQPSADGVAWLKSLGVKSVINLRHYHGDTEKRRVESAGLRYERIKLESSDAPEPEQVARFLELVRDPSLRPLYVHCLHGVDRTGAMMAVYRMEEQGWSNQDAFAEMQYFFAHRMWRDLRAFVKTYKPSRPAPTSARTKPDGR